MGKLISFFVDVRFLLTTVSFVCKAWWEIWRGRRRALRRPEDHGRLSYILDGYTRSQDHRGTQMVWAHRRSWTGTKLQPLYMILPNVMSGFTVLRTAQMQRSMSPCRDTKQIFTKLSAFIPLRQQNETTRNWITRLEGAPEKGKIQKNVVDKWLEHRN